MNRFIEGSGFPRWFIPGKWKKFDKFNSFANSINNLLKIVTESIIINISTCVLKLTTSRNGTYIFFYD